MPLPLYFPRVILIYLNMSLKDGRFVNGYRDSTGSAGTVVVTQRSAALWTDSRYFLEAGNALKKTTIVLMKEGLLQTPTIEDWISTEFREWKAADTKVLINGESFALGRFNELTSRLKEGGLALEVADDLLAGIWKDRPALPSGEMYEIPSEITGEERETRLSRLKKLLPQLEVSAFLICALDEIAWILNLRGSDVAYNPVFYAYLLVSEQRTLLCTHHRADHIRSILERADIQLAGYNEIAPILKNQQGIVGADPVSLNVNIAHLLGKNLKHIPSPVKRWKACKTRTELASTRSVMEQDGAAMVKTPSLD